MKFYLQQIIYSLCIFSIFFNISCKDKTPEKEIQAPKPPAKLLLSEEQLPEYEKNIDHAGLMDDWGRREYRNGRNTYRMICFNCHGNAEQQGSNPRSNRFWKDEFRHGSDPYSMYETLTRGFGLMPPQVRLTPKEKYAVIHFIREEFIKEQNPSQYFEITESYFNTLPKGNSSGPDPSPYQPWAEMDYGDFLIYTYELANSDDPPRIISREGDPLPNEDYRDVNFAYKGIAIRLNKGDGGVAAGNAFVLFDHDLLRLTGFWTGEGFIDYEGILLNDRHNIYPRTVGQIQIENPITPGWENPESGDFKDPRFIAVDGRSFGPLPKKWAHYKGLYYHGQRVIIKYTVHDATVLETYDLGKDTDSPTLIRTLKISPSSKALTMRIAPLKSAVAIVGNEATLAKANGFHVLKIPEKTTVKVKILMAANDQSKLDKLAKNSPPPEDLEKYTNGGPAHDPQVITSTILVGEDTSAYAVDVFTLPLDNPWKSRLRPTGIDFLNDGDEAIISTIDGEVWRLEGISQKDGLIKWHRIASGLFQPLGIKYHNGAIYVTCRDQLTVLRDLNGDGETDYYESFNSDHQVTEHFHEFAMGLQVDDQGNFYYAKSARHARDSLVPQHGTLIKVSADGTTSEIVAYGFRAANGVCINPDGTFIVTDQEGHWNPMNRINWVKPGQFYGNMYGYGAPADTSDSAMQQPLCWVDMKYDRSPAELLWADSNQWGPLNGSLLSLSYGYGKIFVVLVQDVAGIKQGGIVELPVPQFPTGVMRGRFSPKDGQFYLCGMSAWSTTQMIQVGGIYRTRYTGKPLNLPVKMEALQSGMVLRFSDDLDEETATDINSYTIHTWDLKRTHRYGSDRYNVTKLKISGVNLLEDNKSVLIQLPDIKPTWVMEILYKLQDTEGTAFEGAVQNTIYKLDNKIIAHN
jgi:glucose/arabinose dehydrogenase